ncbi:ABC transporter ATP-binding protein/permease [Lactobacillus amylovorus]|uniref:ABC transporter ATP-binding protein/permease n=2 Tax=Lactobacillus amylovorus TaxID=1604 RepID=A0A9X3W600_LACAM|nr:ABC transporter ATP-binding protein [Lactobacillus amylovorus]NLD07060.1 ABC transporter ATP-binding protein [Lactobacillus sp.]MDB6234455.1 ABC transporter ATP-binding protein/permease [Lactobacillus amylovorus]MDB6245242.1 ABC transporter ATP-binding protein/permease [Lactobacillus amylovorus]MDB6249354.1 ABC transporter ATP-binding protein/permease [Lactobacillus amylovorus]MDB6254674.1 ABC transporter ATP-binding protein/permease [Lactobacillus amylovorus]
MDKALENKDQANGHRMKTLGRLLRLIVKTSPWMLTVSMIMIVLAAASNVIGSLFIERLINNYIMPLTKEKVPNYGPLEIAIAVMFGIYAIGFLSNYLFNMLMGVLAQKVQYRVRNEMFTHMESLPISYFDQNEFGDIMSRYTNDIDTLMQMISQSIPQFTNSALSLLFVVCAMFSLSWQLTLFSFIIFALSIGIVRFLTVKSGNYFQIQQKKLGQINGYNEEMLNGLKVIKVFSHEPESKAGFDKYNEELRQASGRANTYATVLFPIMGNIGNLLYVLIAFIGGAVAINQWAPLSLGAIGSFLQLSRQFSMPIAQISQQLNSIVMALAGAERIFNLEDQASEPDDGTVTISKGDEVGSNWNWNVPQKDGSIKKVPVRGHIVFDHVNFSYVPEHQILHDISIDAKPGMKVALVGETGAGKTTISNMLNRFYEIDSGTITYDGIPIKNIKKDDLRQSLSIVLQETHLFTGTIMDNIRFGNPDASDDDVYQAAKLSHADEFIHNLDHGYQTVIDGDGGDLSQGQMQLLSIARAMIADEPVMILDEATSSIDTRTEKMVQAGMDNLLAGRTSFVIAHRLSTIVNSDLILVLDHGHIIERGNHEELLKQKGYYYELYTGKKEIQ